MLVSFLLFGVSWKAWLLFVCPVLPSTVPQSESPPGVCDIGVSFFAVSFLCAAVDIFQILPGGFVSGLEHAIELHSRFCHRTGPQTDQLPILQLRLRLLQTVPKPLVFLHLLDEHFQQFPAAKPF